MSTNSFNAKSTFQANGKDYYFYDITSLSGKDTSRLPYSIKVLLENLLRNEDGHLVSKEDVETLADYKNAVAAKKEIPFIPARVVLQDFTGVPAVVDLAVMRDAVNEWNGDVSQINPLVPVDLVIDHSVQVDRFGTEDAFQHNVEREYERNKERYAFLRWAQKSFKNFTVVPPGTGIVHQVNLEYLASIVQQSKDETPVVYPDTLVGTDSHTTMINGLSVVGWGVGGIEAEAVMLGQPIYMQVPEVIGMRLEGSLPEGATATDLVLRVVEMLRKKGVVDKFVEFYGPGLDNLTLPDRATIANMAPEYGATIGFFPVDECTLDYMKLTGREEDLINLIREYTKRQGLYRTSDAPEPEFIDTLSLDMTTIVPNLAGPKRPQDCIALSNMKTAFAKILQTPVKDGGFALGDEQLQKKVEFEYNGEKINLQHGSVVIAAITSCTNTSNPSVLIAAGIVAKKALEKGLHVKPWVKTSFAPGSRVVTDYLENSGLLESLRQQKFHLVGYGCTTCIGNSGPLPEEVEKAINDGNLVAASVLSGNRNFEGRIHAAVKANYLASPPLVVAFALTGRVDIDLSTEPIGQDQDGNDVFLKDIWPSNAEIQEYIGKFLSPKSFQERYSEVYAGDDLWRNLPTSESQIYSWSNDSTYIRQAPYFHNMKQDIDSLQEIKNARCLVKLGDSVTTDHISPAGSIPANGPAGKYLQEHGVELRDFNSFGSRRGNHDVMIRGTFANVRIKNQLVPGVEGGYTKYLVNGEQMSIFDASMKYQEANTPLIVLAGKEYGTGSSRDWAAKGTILLGVKAVIAESYERIHRSNLIGMGVLPLEFKSGESASRLGLTGEEVFHILGIDDNIAPRTELKVKAVAADGAEKEFTVINRLDTAVEVDYYKNGGILKTVLRQLAQA